MSHERRSIDRIVVGVDGSEGSTAGLRWAAGLAAAGGGRPGVAGPFGPGAVRRGGAS
jgi:Universal stress protein family